MDAGIIAAIIAAAAAVVSAGVVVYTTPHRTNRQSQDEGERARRWERARWAAELATSSQPLEARMGVFHLHEMAAAFEADDDLRRFVRTSITAALSTQIRAYRSEGGDLRFVIPETHPEAQTPPELESGGRP